MTRPGPGTLIVRLGPGDEARLRAIRLRALEDAPGAFATTLEVARGWPVERWRAQLEPRATFVAVRNGVDVGVARGDRDPEAADCAWLLSMWVAPEARQRGIGRMLIAEVVAWAQDAGCERMLLDVSDDHAAAIACYAALGFAATGVTGTLPAPRSHLGEHRRERRLR